ncbi:MAG: thioredoxin domain-containing protein [Deltaproteobacteria bacterium]|nr:thioredoxin domain-containing protein [Deltaproteobacteria bacterium]
MTIRCSLAARALACLALISVLALAGCGGSATLAANTNTSDRAASSVSVVLAPFRVTLPNGVVIALDAAGAVTVDGATFGTLHDDGRLSAADGTTIATLLADGQLSFRGELSTFRIQSDQLLGAENEETIVVAPPDRLESRSPSGEVTAQVPVVGLTETNHATLLFVVASIALDRIGADQDGGTDVADADEDTSEPLLRVPVEGAPQRGPTDALVTIVVFSDFQCPFCSRVVPTLEQVVDRYGHDVRIVFRHNPLPFHQNAMIAAEASMEALAQQGPAGFWRMHDILFENQQALDMTNLESYAQQLGLDLTRFRLAMQNHTHQAAIQADMALAARVGARGTPTFFLNGRAFVGAQPIEAFVERIDGARAAAQRRVASGTPRAGLYDRLLAEAATDAPAPEPRHPPAPEPDDSQRRYTIGDGGSAPSRGPRTAPVTIQIFSDFQCPFCSRAVPTVDRIVQAYGARVRVVFRNYPLPFHPWAQEAAELSLEIRHQRGDAAFWQFHDLVFENQRAVSDAATARDGLLALARQIRGVDVRRAARALDQHTHTAAVQADMDAVRTAGAQIGTPSFFINGRLLQGAQPFEAFQRVIDEELAAPTP